jgi:hypothetical protein
MTTQSEKSKSFTEPARQIKVVREVDVVVVGGGPGGIGSAVAAARSGAKTLLLERYGHLGGMATGGLVNIIPNLSDINGKQYLFGLNQELMDRLTARGAASYPAKADWGSAEDRVVDYYHRARLDWFYIRDDYRINRKRVLYTAVVDPEVFKDELNDMVAEAGADLLLHAWGVLPIMEGNRAAGVIFESKSGRQAVLARVVIDATGDGDLFVAAGAEFDNKLDPKLRTAMLANVMWLTHVDIKKFIAFRDSQANEYEAVMKAAAAQSAHPQHFLSVLKNHEDCVWFHIFQPRADGRASDAMDVNELTRVDIQARKKALVTWEFYRNNVPGFEKSIIMTISPQLGLQGGRRVVGEYTLSEKDLVTDEVFEDTIAVFANNDNGPVSIDHPTLCIPYRTMVPKDVEGMLVACRAYSTADTINHQFNIIPHCIALGQAAGTAAALAAKEGVQPRGVDYKDLQRNLIGQGVYLPGAEMV